MKSMLLQHNVSLWIQLSPFSRDGDFRSQYDMSKYCEVLPLTRFTDPSHPDSAGVSNISYTHHDEEYYFSTSFTLEGRRRNGLWEAVREDRMDATRQDSHGALRFHSATNNTTAHKIHVNHIWFYQWQDFGVPNDRGEEVSSCL